MTLYREKPKDNRLDCGTHGFALEARRTLRPVLAGLSLLTHVALGTGNADLSAVPLRPSAASGALLALETRETWKTWLPWGAVLARKTQVALSEDQPHLVLCNFHFHH